MTMTISKTDPTPTPRGNGCLIVADIVTGNESWRFQRRLLKLKPR
jgi:hypothetical protein